MLVLTIQIRVHSVHGQSNNMFQTYYGYAKGIIGKCEKYVYLESSQIGAALIICPLAPGFLTI